MQFATLNSGDISLPQDALDSLSAQLSGPLLTAADPAFEESRTVWNGMIDRTPALVARCRGVADVQMCVRFARKHDLLLCIKGGGHNIGGLAVADGAFLLDMSLMRGVWVDEDERVAHAQAGCLLGDVDRETQLHGLAAVLGFVSLTGIAGYTLGGGFGYLSRRFGWAVDNVKGMDVVTAEGALVRASATENRDLFWGLRGGGGNFGVVTSVDYVLHPVGPEVMGGMVVWPASDAPAVLELYRELAEAAPPELTLVLMMRPAPAAPWLPEEYHFEPIVGLLACHTGDPEAGERAVAPIKEFGQPIGDVLVRRPYTQVQSLFDATQPKGRRYYWKSEYLPGVGRELDATIMEHAATIPSPHTGIILFHLAGALNELDAGHSPVGNREAHYVINLGSAWDDPADDAENIAWTRAAWADMKPFSTGGTYLNFLTEDDGQDRVESALGGALGRLATIKRDWDPDNVFRTNRNIPPA